MRDKPVDTHQAAIEQTRGLVRWTRQYAQNRSIPVVIMLLISLSLSVVLFVLWRLTGVSYRSGNTVVLWLCVPGLVLAHLALLYLSIPKLGGRLVERISRRFYRNEGRVALVVPVSRLKKKWVPLTVAFLFGACIVGNVVLGWAGYFSEQYMQPISAAYMVPFLVFLVFWVRPTIGYLALLWPGLYGLHAILVVAGAPIQFDDPWQGLNMFLPVVGYGLIATGASHLYSRFALARVKRLAQMDVSEGR